MESLKEKTAKGLLWGMLNSGTMQVLNLVIGVFLARLLSRADYGIIGVLTIFTAIAGNLQSAGFTQALINIKKPTDNDYNSIFWFNVLSSLAIYAILFFCAPLIAAYFHQDCLVEVSRFVFLAFVISSFGIAHNAYLLKNIMIRETTIAGFVALVVSGCVGIVLAVKEMAYWSLAWQQVTYISVLNIVRLRYSKWRPTLKIDFGPVRGMFGFSVKILFTNIINTVSQNVLTVIFGNMYPMKSVGSFTQANKWSTQAHSFVSSTIAQVIQPVLASVTDEKEREKRIFRKMTRFTAFLSFPALFGFALVSREFIIVTITDKWVECVPLMQILCVSGALIPFYTLCQNLIIANRRSDVYLWCNIVQIALQIAVILFCARYDMTIMVAAYSVLNIAYLLVWQTCAWRIAGVGVRDMLADIMPFFIITAGIIAVTYFATCGIEVLLLRLFCRMAMVAILYVAAMKVFKAQIMDECIEFVKSKRRRRADD